MTGHSSPEPAPPGGSAPQPGSPHAGTAHRPKDGGPPNRHPEAPQSSEAFDASAYRSNPLPPNPAYEEFQREYAARYAAYSEPVVSRRRRGFRAIHMALIFTLGAAAGLTGAWWADSSGPRSTASSPVPGIVSVKPDLPPYEQLIQRDRPQPARDAQGSQSMQGAQGTQGVRGIRSSELPYDGKPPTESEEALASAPAASLPSAAISSGASVGNDEEDAALTPRPQAPVAPQATETARKSSASPDPARDAPLASAGRAPGAGDGRAKDADGKASGPAAQPKRATVAKNGKDQEIERMRRQADDELKKKNSAPRRADEGRNASRVAQKNQGSDQAAATLPSSNNYKVLLAQCEAASNIFRREQCKWKLCNGMWGKNGCPSYAKPNNAYNY